MEFLNNCIICERPVQDVSKLTFTPRIVTLEVFKSDWSFHSVNTDSSSVFQSWCRSITQSFHLTIISSVWEWRLLEDGEKCASSELELSKFPVNGTLTSCSWICRIKKACCNVMLAWKIRVMFWVFCHSGCSHQPQWRNTSEFRGRKLPAKDNQSTQSQKLLFLQPHLLLGVLNISFMNMFYSHKTCRWFYWNFLQSSSSFIVRWNEIWNMTTRFSDSILQQNIEKRISLGWSPAGSWTSTLCCSLLNISQCFSRLTFFHITHIMWSTTKCCSVVVAEKTKKTTSMFFLTKHIIVFLIKWKYCNCKQIKKWAKCIKEKSWAIKQ